MATEKFETVNGFVQVPQKTFEEMSERLEELEDIIAFDRAVAAHEEAFPLEFVKALADGQESRVKLWRNYRNIKQDELARMVGCGKSMISQIEAGTTPGSIALMKKMAKALQVDLDDLV